jgi:hypothetical protein
MLSNVEASKGNPGIRPKILSFLISCRFRRGMRNGDTVWKAQALLELYHKPEYFILAKEVFLLTAFGFMTILPYMQK